MNSITVWKDGKKILEFFSSPELMGGGCENSLRINDFYKFAPVIIVKCFDIWAAYSNCNGTNPTMKIKFDDVEYIFVNHYWD